MILYFPESAASAKRLAEQLDLPHGEIAVHRFPDHEGLVRIPSSAETVIIYRSLDKPDGKIMELLLAASAARDGGARRVILVCPYLAYMRQDIAFHAGEAVSQRVIGKLLAQHFDAVFTVDPHLHRIASLGEVMTGIPAVAISAAPILAGAIDRTGRPVIVGPDSESLQWTSAIAMPLGLPMLLGEKVRQGDRDVSIRIDGIEQAKVRRVVLVDDVISSGETLIAAAKLLLEAGALGVGAMATHCLASEADLARMGANGIDYVVATDSIPGPAASLSLAPLLAEAIRNSGLLQP